MKEDLLKEKSYALAKAIVRLYTYLRETKKEFVLSNQVLRSGTSIWAMIREAKYAQSRADFINKASIALKEANETLYRLELLHDSNYINESIFNSLHPLCESVLKLLISSIKTAKKNRGG